MSIFCSCLNDHSINPSIQGTVTNVYHAQVSTQREPMIISLTWSKTRAAAAAPSLSIAINSNPVITNSTTTQGEINNTTIAVFWDYSKAKHESTPEPVSNFYVAIAVDAEFVLLLGDKSKKLVRRHKGMMMNVTAQSTLVSRMVQVGGQAMYSTKARFRDDGKEHGVVVRCRGESELLVCVDEKEVVCVRRLRWNFRGVETVFVDGVAVDVMWDLYEWLFSNPPGCAAVLFRRRGEEGGKRSSSEEGMSGGGVSVLIQVFREPS